MLRRMFPSSCPPLLHAPADAPGGTLGAAVVGSHELRDKAVQFAHLADMPARSLLGRDAGDGQPRALSASEAREVLAGAAPALEAATLAEAEALFPGPQVEVIRTRGFLDPADWGGGEYVRAAGEPSHPGKLQTADGQWWRLRDPRPTPEAFGAVGDGLADDVEAIEGAFEYLRELGGGVLHGRPGAVYGISRPLVYGSGPHVVFDGGGLRGQFGSAAQIRKLTGFSGEAAVIWGGSTGFDNSASVFKGGGLRGFHIDGNGQEGAGLVLRKVSQGVFEALSIEDNQGWGIVIDGCWLVEVSHCAVRHNGGGWRLTNSERKNSQLTLYMPQGGNNKGRQLLIESHPTDKRLQPSQIVIFGGIFELPDIEDGPSEQPVAEVEAVNELRCFGTHFMQIGQGGPHDGQIPPALRLGRAGHVLLPQNVQFSGATFQHGHPSDDPRYAAVTFGNEVGFASFWHPGIANVGFGSRFMDASALSASRIRVSGPVGREDLIDPNGVVALDDAGLDAAQAEGGQAVRLGPAGGAGRLSLGRRDGSGAWIAGLDVGSGASGRLLTPRDMDLQLQPKQAAEEPDAAGTLFYWDGSGPSPDGGANGEGLYLRKSAGFVFVA